MYTDFVFVEFLRQDGVLDTFLFRSGDSDTWPSSLVLDHLTDIHPAFKPNGAFDVGPIRIYEDVEHCLISRIRSVLSPDRFTVLSDGKLNLSLEHHNLPVGEAYSHRGYYCLLLPRGYSLVELHIRDPYHSSKEFQRHVTWDRTNSRHSILVELRSRRGGFSLRVNAELIPSMGEDRFRRTNAVVHDSLDSIGPSGWKLAKALQGSEAQNNGVFLSHSHHDRRFSRQLTDDLYHEGFPVWLDEAELQVGDSLVGAVQSAIDASRFLVPVISQNSVVSRWCQEELHQALAGQFRDGRIRVLPVVLDDCEIPGFLREKVYANFMGWATEREAYWRGLKALVSALSKDNL